MLQPIFLLMVLIFLNAVFASAEIAVISMSDLKLRQLCEAGLRFKRLLSEGQYDLVLQELDVFEKELDDLARGFGVELDRLPEEPSWK